MHRVHIWSDPRPACAVLSRGLHLTVRRDECERVEEFHYISYKMNNHMPFCETLSFTWTIFTNKSKFNIIMSVCCLWVCVYVCISSVFIQLICYLSSLSYSHLRIYIYLLLSVCLRFCRFRVVYKLPPPPPPPPPLLRSIFLEARGGFFPRFFCHSHRHNTSITPRT